MNMNQFSESICNDAFSVCFKTPDEMTGFLAQLSENDEWLDSETAGIETVVIPDLPLLDIQTFYREKIDVEVPLLGSTKARDDTAKNTLLGLIVPITCNQKKSLRCLMLGDTGVSTLASRLGVAAPGPQKVMEHSRSDYAKVLNICTRYQKKNMKLLIRGEKIRAVNSLAGGKGYSVLDEHELTLALLENLDRDFPDNVFKGGEWTHSELRARWDFPVQADALIKAYKVAMEHRAVSRYTHDFIPSIVFTTSDTAQSAASVTAYLRSPKTGLAINIGSAMKVVHKNNSNVGDFKKATNSIFSRFVERIENLTELLDVHIEHPENTLLNLMSNYRLKRSYIDAALKELAGMYLPGDCTGHDIYFAMSSVIPTIEQDSAAKADEYAETIARVLHFNKSDWKEFDLSQAYIYGK